MGVERVCQGVNKTNPAQQNDAKRVFQQLLETGSVSGRLPHPFSITSKSAIQSINSHNEDVQTASNDEEFLVI